tara:strand:- start:374 stop:841 length:468 start_codon:yes stop_codon:yes gene_type:complete
MKQTYIGQLAALDFEASSLSPDGWPIEIGISWIDGGIVRTWSSLIRPHSEWDITDWSPQSAAVHRISLSDLQIAPLVTEVATAFFRALGSRRLVSDAPKFETRWLSRFLDASDIDYAPGIEDFPIIHKKKLGPTPYLHGGSADFAAVWLMHTNGL